MPNVGLLSLLHCPQLLLLRIFAEQHHRCSFSYKAVEQHHQQSAAANTLPFPSCNLAFAFLLISALSPKSALTSWTSLVTPKLLLFSLPLTEFSADPQQHRIRESSCSYRIYQIAVLLTTSLLIYGATTGHLQHQHISYCLPDTWPTSTTYISYNHHLHSQTNWTLLNTQPQIRLHPRSRSVIPQLQSRQGRDAIAHGPAKSDTGRC